MILPIVTSYNSDEKVTNGFEYALVTTQSVTAIKKNLYNTNPYSLIFTFLFSVICVICVYNSLTTWIFENGMLKIKGLGTKPQETKP